jgi:hypothetical protein
MVLSAMGGGAAVRRGGGGGGCLSRGSPTVGSGWKNKGRRCGEAEGQRQRGG